MTDDVAQSEAPPREAQEHAEGSAVPGNGLSQRARLAMTVGPFVGYGCILLAAWVVAGHKVAAFLFGAVVASFLGAGKFVVLAHLIWRDPPVGSWTLVALIVYSDLAAATIMMGNLDVLYRLPFLGRRLAACREAGWYVLQANPWMRRAAWSGIALFVAVPFQYTGSVVGTVVARILGVSRFHTATATVAGSALGCSALALLGVYARDLVRYLDPSPVLVVAEVLLIVALLVLLGRRFTGKSLRRARNGSA
jgi:uncharacterized membrane protein